MKQIKFLGVLAIALTLGLASCNKPSESGGQDSQTEEHVHTFETEWTSNATKHWHKATCEHKNVKGDEADHTFGQPYDVQPATCTADGSQKVKCSVCNYEKTEKLPKLGHDAPPAADSDAWTPIDSPDCENIGHHSYHCSKCNTDVVVEIPALGHVYEQEDGQDKVVWTREADCTNTGVGTKTCTRPGCGHVENVSKPALGHVYEQVDGQDKVVWEKEASCEEDGVGTKTCTRCHAEEKVTAPKLGHHATLIGGEVTPPEGEAAVRLYECDRCNQTFLGFSADEPSAESLPHLMKGDNDGMRFFGRPIGNSLALTADGTSVNRTNNECVYCSTETGDFFEYVFTLNAEQAATLATCRLYCDARPADNLSGDFWAYSGSATDWTPGYYIDGAEDHIQKNTDGTTMMVKDHARCVNASETDRSQAEGAELETEVPMGARITDYRYVLYVDNVIQELDADTAVPVEGSGSNMVRKEYVLPFTFHLHEGKNRISLRMAGGYRSEFYNFIFRPYVEPTPVTVNQTKLEINELGTAAITSSMEGLTYASSSNSVATVDANGVVKGLKAGTATITVSKEGNYKPAKVEVTVKAAEGTFEISAQKGVIAPEGGAEWYNSQWGGGSRLRNFKKDSTVTFTFDSKFTGQSHIIFNARGADVNFADHITVKVNNADVTVSGSYNSANSGVDVVIGQANLKAKDNTLVITTISTNSPINLHYIKFIPGEGAELVPEEPEPVVTVVNEWSLETIIANRTDSGWESTKDFGGENGQGFKFNKAGSYTVSYTAAAAQKVKLQLKIAVKQSNNALTGFWKQDGAEKTRITFNGTAVTAPATEPDFTGSTASTLNDGGTISTPEWYDIIELDLIAGENTIKVEFIAGGYSYYMAGARLVK